MEILQKFDVVDDKIFDLSCKLAKLNDDILPPLTSLPNRTIKLNQGAGILLSNTNAQDLSQNREWTISVDTSNLLNFSFTNSYFDNSQSGTFTGIARRINNTLYGLIDNNTNQNVTFTKVVTKPNNTAYSDADVDGITITKKGSEYFKINDKIISLDILNKANIRSDLTMLNKAGDGNLNLLTRDSSLSEVVYNLQNVGTGSFSGTVSGAPAVNNNEFVTKQQLSASTSSTFSDTGFTI